MSAAIRELPELAELLPQITTPVTIINGRHDRVVPLANAEYLDARLPNSRIVIIDAGHFVWEEAPAEYASVHPRVDHRSTSYRPSARRPRQARVITFRLALSVSGMSAATTPTSHNAAQAVIDVDRD